MKKVYLWIMLFCLIIATTLAFLFWPSLFKFERLSLINKKCNTGFQGVQYEFAANRTAKKIFSSVGLIEARDKRSFRFLTFVGDLQIITPGFSPITVDCGETKEVEYNSDKIPKDSVTNVLIRELPVIPNRLVKAKPSSRFQGTESFLLDYALDRSDFKTLQLDKRKHYFVENNLKETSLVSARLNDGYIFFLKKDTPNHVFYSARSKIPFGIYFSDVPDKSNRVYTITCLLNDRQIYAFDNKRSWVGRMNRGQGVYLSGEVNLDLGWNQLRCVVLNNIYDIDISPTLYPSNIRATYIYLSEPNT